MGLKRRLQGQEIQCHRCGEFFWDTRGQTANGRVCWECELRADVDRDKPTLPVDAETKPSLWLRASTEVVCQLPMAALVAVVLMLAEHEWFCMLLMIFGACAVGWKAADWIEPTMTAWRDRRLHQ